MSGCTNFFYYPSRDQFSSPSDFGIEFKDVYFDSGGNKLHGWFLPAKTEQVFGTVLFLHGNAENISTHIASVYWLPAEGFNVFLPDYRGYGQSEGKAEIAGMHVDIERALEVLLERPEVGEKAVAVFGQSLGGSMAVYLVANTAHKKRIKALVLGSPFSSYRKIAREKLASFFLTYPFSPLLALTVTDRFSPMKFIDQISPIPLLIVHGDNDEIVPLHHGEALFEAAGEPKELLVVKEGNHMSTFQDQAVRERMLEFLKNPLGG